MSKKSPVAAFPDLVIEDVERLPPPREPWDGPPTDFPDVSAQQASSSEVAEKLIGLFLETNEIKETLKCHLTQNEIREYGILLAQTTAEISQAEDELQAVKSQYKSRIDKSIASRNEYSQKINQGFEFRHVDCRLIKDYQEYSVSVVRMDTGETVRVRVMTADERQGGLEL